MTKIITTEIATKFSNIIIVVVVIIICEMNKIGREWNGIHIA